MEGWFSTRAHDSNYVSNGQLVGGEDIGQWQEGRWWFNQSPRNHAPSNPPSHVSSQPCRGTRAPRSARCRSHQHFRAARRSWRRSMPGHARLALCPVRADVFPGSPDSACAAEYQLDFPQTPIRSARRPTASGRGCTLSSLVDDDRARSQPTISINPDHSRQGTSSQSTTALRGSSTRGPSTAGAARRWSPPPDGAIAAGAWPNRRGEWQQVESSITLNTAASMLYWFVGYPIKSSRGSVYATGLEMHQLGTATLPGDR